MIHVPNVNDPEVSVSGVAQVSMSGPDVAQASMSVYLLVGPRRPL